jgi:CRP-like cAMP-binding protein
MAKATPPSAEHARLITKLESIARLTREDCAAIAALPLRTRSVDAGVDIVAEGERPNECCLVIDGLLCRYSTTGSGDRQIVSFHIAGDLPDRDSLHLAAMDHGVSSVSHARVALIPQAALLQLIEACPNVALALWRDTVTDGGIYRQWLTSVGRRTARQRLAHLVCETYTRMEAVGLADGDHFAFPVTQSQLGDALGLSAVHVNRTLQELRHEGLLSWKGPVVMLIDHPGLRAAGDFDPGYLRLKPLEG